MQLHCGEQQDAYRLAREWFKDLRLDIGDLGAFQFELEFQYQLVAKMLLRAGAQDSKATVLEGGAEARKELTPNEVVWFIDQHTKLQEQEMSAWTDSDKGE